MMYGMHRNRHGGGVALCVRDSYTSLLLQNLCICEPSVECVCVEAVCGDKYFLGPVYRLPNGIFPDFILELIIVLSALAVTLIKQFYFFDDWNINLLIKTILMLLNLLT